MERNGTTLAFFTFIQVINYVEFGIFFSSTPIPACGLFTRLLIVITIFRNKRHVSRCATCLSARRCSVQFGASVIVIWSLYDQKRVCRSTRVSFSYSSWFDSQGQLRLFFCLGMLFCMCHVLAVLSFSVVDITDLRNIRNVGCFFRLLNTVTNDEECVRGYEF
jgi:hypothetical protein